MGESSLTVFEQPIWMHASQKMCKTTQFPEFTYYPETNFFEKCYETHCI